MAEYEIPRLTGRQVLYTSVPKSGINENTIPAILQGVAIRHQTNISDIQYLLDVYLGEQQILEREREFSTNVNNRVVVNRAKEIVRKVNGYFLGEPISYTSRAEKSGEGGDVDNLNVLMQAEGKAAKDIAMGEWTSIAGTAYRVVAVPKNAKYAPVPFRIPTCDPRSTGVIYSADIFEEPVLGFSYAPVLDNNGNVNGYITMAYTDTTIYTYKTDGTEPLSGVYVLDNKYDHLLSEMPVIEYPNNQWRVGDFEPALGLMDMLNLNLSDRVNAVVQAVGSLLVFVDCEPDEDGTEKIKQSGCIAIKSNGQKLTEIKYVSPDLSQADTQILEQTINDYIDAVTGIPSRQKTGGNSGDTGDAVYLRDGYQDLELVVRNKESSFRLGEIKMLRLIARIMNRYGMPLDANEIQINFVRNRATNILNKSQAAANFIATNMFDLVDVVKMIGVTDQPAEMAARGLKHFEYVGKMNSLQAEKENKNVAEDNSEADNKTENADEATTD